MNDLLFAMLAATCAGATIPLGGFVARIERIRPAWLESEFRHSVIAFGGGVLFAAIALVLVPEGMAAMAPGNALAAFGAGDFWMETNQNRPAVSSSFWSPA